jgi:hypothetical protein
VIVEVHSVRRNFLEVRPRRNGGLCAPDHTECCRGLLRRRGRETHFFAD